MTRRAGGLAGGVHGFPVQDAHVTWEGHGSLKVSREIRTS